MVSCEPSLSCGNIACLADERLLWSPSDESDHLGLRMPYSMVSLRIIYSTAKARAPDDRDIGAPHGLIRVARFTNPLAKLRKSNSGPAKCLKVGERISAARTLYGLLGCFSRIIRNNLLSYASNAASSE